MSGMIPIHMSFENGGDNNNQLKISGGLENSGKRKRDGKEKADRTVDNILYGKLRNLRDKVNFPRNFAELSSKIPRQNQKIKIPYFT